MDAFDSIDAFIEDIRKALDLEALRLTLARHLEDLGFEKFSFQKLVPATGTVQKFYLSTYPRAWITRYNENRYINVDRYALAAGTFSRAYNWSEVGRFDEFDPKMRRAVEESHDFGIKTGASVPVFDWSGPRAHLALATPLSQTEFDKLFKKQRFIVSVIGGFLHEHASLFGFYDKKERKLEPLTERERDVLSWYARGKKAPQIEELLGIANDTVETHLRNARRKLRAKTTTHAVAIAVGRRLISP